MFYVPECSPEEILKSILACQANENPEVRVIEAKGLFIQPLPVPPKEKRIEWHESGLKSPNEWRRNVQDLFD